MSVSQVVVSQDTQTEEVQVYFCQWGPVNSCQLAHNDSALIGLISRQDQLQVKLLTDPLHLLVIGDPMLLHSFFITVLTLLTAL